MSQIILLDDFWEASTIPFIKRSSHYAIMMHRFPSTSIWIQGSSNIMHSRYNFILSYTVSTHLGFEADLKGFLAGNKYLLWSVSTHKHLKMKNSIHFILPGFVVKKVKIKVVTYFLLQCTQHHRSTKLIANRKIRWSLTTPLKSVVKYVANLKDVYKNARRNQRKMPKSK